MAVGARKPPPSSPTLPEPKHVTLQHLCAKRLPPPSSPDGQLSSPTQHSRHLQPASFLKIQPTITISMATPHPSVTSSHNSHQTPQTPAASPPIHPDSTADFLFGLYLLDFAHLETGQYKNSPNAWMLTSKTAP